MGVLYEQGRSCVVKDEEIAVRWFRKAAKQGHARAQYNLGVMMETCRGGLARDEAKVASWFRKAAEQRHAGALFRLSAYHDRGRGGFAKDVAAAACWYFGAAEQGHEGAQGSMGQWYGDTVNLPQNYAAAAGWLRAAAEHGDSLTENIPADSLALRERIGWGSMLPYFSCACGAEAHMKQNDRCWLSRLPTLTALAAATKSSPFAHLPQPAVALLERPALLDLGQVSPDRQATVGPWVPGKTALT